MAARAAVSSPLLDVSIEGAKGILFNITGGSDMTMSEVDEAAKIVAEAADADANIIFGATIDEKLVDQMRITVIATGFDETRSRLASMVSRNRPVPQTQTPYGIVSEKPKMAVPPAPAAQNIAGQPSVENTPPVELPEDEQAVGSDDLDIPAFLRQGR